MRSEASFPRAVRFGVFEFDPRAGELRKQGMKLKLQGQPIEILALLLKRPGEVITREELQKKLWPSDTFVDFEHGLNAAVNRLREAFGDSAEEPRFIETVPRRGYRFVASLEGRASASARRRVSKWVAIGGVAAVALLAALVTLNVGGWRERFLGGSRKPIRSLAVLPLANLSSNSEQDYFVDGMTEALITELGKISALRVISRQSMMQYKGTKKSAREIARELSVEALVEGSAVREGDRVRVSVQLIGAVPERHLWANSYDRDLRDVLKLHSEIARAVAGEVRAKLTPQEHGLLASAQPVNSEAYENYLHGMHLLWDEVTADSARRAIPHFERAIGLEPSWAAPHCGLAYSYIGLGHLGALPPRDTFPVGKAAASKAQQLDDSAGCAHLALAQVYFLYDWTWPAAEKEYRRAIELSPGDAFAHFEFAHFLAATGKTDEAVAQAKRTLQRQGDEARRILQDLKQPSGKNYVDPWLIVLVYVGLGEKDQAMEWLEKAYQNRSHDIVFSKVWPQFDPLRSDPRFQDLLRRMNFPLNTPNSFN